MVISNQSSARQVMMPAIWNKPCHCDGVTVLESEHVSC